MRGIPSLVCFHLCRLLQPLLDVAVFVEGSVLRISLHLFAMAALADAPVKLRKPVLELEATGAAWHTQRSQANCRESGLLQEKWAVLLHTTNLLCES